MELDIPKINVTANGCYLEDNAYADDINEILPGLFLGNHASPYLKEYDFIINLSNTDLNLELLTFTVNNEEVIDFNSDLTLDELVKGYKVLNINIEDSSNENIEVYFPLTYQLIDHFFKINKRILVYCRAGISRSATIVMNYIMGLKDCDYNVAYDYVSGIRNVISPNFGFMCSLVNYNSA